MGDQNEGTKILNGVVGVLLFCIAVSCVITLLVLAQREENKFIEDMHNATNSAQMARMTELDMQSDPVLCTAAANVLSEFGETELLYVAISAPSEGTIVYHNPLVTVSVAGSEVTDNQPVALAVKKLLSNSDKYCYVHLGDDDGNPWVLVEVID